MDKPKRLLVLGGSHFQVPLIEKAKEMGLYVITCDYLPDNPGHALSHEYHNVSTTDRDAVLDVAKRCRADAITTFCSDPAVPTVAYVAETLGLPGPSLSAVEALIEKDRFRALMLEIGLNVPNSFTVREGQLPEGIDPDSQYMVKPVDSSGSKGITRSSGQQVSLQKAVDYALTFSRSGRCIIESYIEGKQVHGDAFVKNGQVVYYYLGDHYFFTDTNSFIPISTRWPASISKNAMESVIEQVEKISQAAGYLDGPVNIEARIGSDDVAYIIEVGPRNGGNFVPLIQQRLTGFDFTQAVIDIAIGKQVVIYFNEAYSPGAHYILHAPVKGIFGGVDLGDELKKSLFFSKILKKEGEEVHPYTGSNNTLGVLLFEFSSNDERDMLMSKVSEIAKVLINEEKSRW